MKLEIGNFMLIYLGAAMPWALHKLQGSGLCPPLPWRQRKKRFLYTSKSFTAIFSWCHSCWPFLWLFGNEIRVHKQDSERRKETSQGGDHSASIIVRKWGSSVTKLVCAGIVGHFLALQIFPRDYRSWGVPVPFIRKEGSREYWIY